MLKVIERATGKVVNEWNMENVKSYPKFDTLDAMRNDEKHESFYFMIEFKGLEYGLGMWEVDKYDLVIA